MSRLSSVIAHIHNTYPNAQEDLLIERLIKIIYLSDWKYAIAYKEQITEVLWQIRDFQPWMDEVSVEELIEVLAKIRIGQSLKLNPPLNHKHIEILEFVIDTAARKDENQLSQLVHSTYPALIQNNSSEQIYLVGLAQEYNEKVKPQLKTVHRH